MRTILHHRQNQVLAAILAIQLVLVAIVYWPRSPSRASEGEAFFSELDQVVRLTIRDGEGVEIALHQSDTGWVLPEADDYPCQETKVSEFLDKVAELKTDRLVTQTETSHKRLKVSEQDFERAIVLEWADGTSHKLYLGNSPSYQVVHARADAQDEVYLVSGLSTVDVGTAPSAWIDTLYFSVPQDQIVAFTLENANGHFEFARTATEDDATWTMNDLAADETLSQNNVTSLVNRIVSLRMLGPLGREEQETYGIKTPSALVTVQTRDEGGASQTYLLRVGAKSDEDNSYVVISSRSPYYVRASEYAVRDLVEKTRQDFLELPSTPTPEPAS